jgi:hypothetical protein
VASSARDQLVFDAWTPMSFKRQLGNRAVAGSTGSAGASFSPPPWVPAEHHRRQMAYAILRAYADNAAREFMATQDRNEIDSRREYGEAALLISTVVGALLGEDQTIVTEGAEDIEQGEEGGNSEAGRALKLQEWLQQWAKDERLGLKMIETERLAVMLGDGVYLVGWDDDKERPHLQVFDPTFYFPVLDDDEDDYPSRVHLAWEVFDAELEKQNKVKIRRITHQLGPIMPAGGAEAMTNSPDAELIDGDEFDPETGRITRQYPWNDKPSSVTCYKTDATWTLDTANRTIDDLTMATAEFTMDEDGPINARDLGIDFMPIIHVPNTVSLINHYGRSTLATVLQILDDIANADTDLSAAAATTGSPVIALQGARVEKDSTGHAKLTYRPGEILESGDGKLDVLDTSSSLAALIGYIEFLLKRLSVNSRVAEALLGRIKSTEVSSGFHMLLSFGPTDQMVKEMRLVRAEKYPLMLKFVHRLAQIAGMPDVPPEWIHSEVVMGSFLPQDQAAMVDQVTEMIRAKTISLQTGMGMLIEAGVPIKDALEEIQRINERDFEGAEALLAATEGDMDQVYKYLGLGTPPEKEESPEIVIDPAQVGPDGLPTPQPPAPPAPQPLVS